MAVVRDEDDLLRALEAAPLGLGPEVAAEVLYAFGRGDVGLDDLLRRAPLLALEAPPGADDDADLRLPPAGVALAGFPRRFGPGRRIRALRLGGITPPPVGLVGAVAVAVRPHDHELGRVGGRGRPRPDRGLRPEELAVDLRRLPLEHAAGVLVGDRVSRGLDRPRRVAVVVSSQALKQLLLDARRERVGGQIEQYVEGGKSRP